MWIENSNLESAHFTSMWKKINISSNSESKMSDYDISFINSAVIAIVQSYYRQWFEKVASCLL